MEKETYKNDVLVAVTLLLCLWFKLDAVIEYGIENISCISIASCILLVIVIMSMALWLLFTNSSSGSSSKVYRQRAIQGYQPR